MNAEAPPGHPIRILVVDDHALFRHGVCEVLSEQDDIQVVAQAASGEEAVRLASELEPRRLDLVLMDLDMPGIGGVQATRRIHAHHPDLPVIMLTVSSLDRDLFAAVEAGAVGFLTKNLAPQAIVRALRAYHREGALPMPRTFATRALMHLRDKSQQAPRDTNLPAEVRGLDPLSPREREVLELIAEGESDRQIGKRLVLSENTVKKHVKAILAKLGARNRAQAAARLRSGTR